MALTVNVLVGRWQGVLIDDSLAMSVERRDIEAGPWDYALYRHSR